MNQRVNRNIVVAFSVICFLFLFLTLYSVYTNKRFLFISKELQGTNMLMKDLAEISAVAHEAIESAEQFSTTHNTDYFPKRKEQLAKLALAITKLSDYAQHHEYINKNLAAVSLGVNELEDYLVINLSKENKEPVNRNVWESRIKNIEEQVIRSETNGRLHLRWLENRQQQLVIRADFFNYLMALLSIAFLFILFMFIQIQFNKRKRAEEELKYFNEELEREVERKTKELTDTFNRITDAFIALDKNWCYTYVNKKAAELHGRTEDSLLGKNIWTEFPDVVHEPFYDALHRAMESQCAENIQLYYSREDQWFEDFIYPSPNGVSVYYQDITKRKRDEEELRISELRYRSLVEQASDGIFIASHEGRYLDVNTAGCELLGYSREELLGMSSKDILFHRHKIAHLPSRYESMLSGKKVISENILRHKNGEPVYTETNMHMLPDHRFIGIVRNIGERKKQENIIQQASRNMKIILDNTEEAFIVLNKNLEVVTFNKTAEEGAVSFIGIPVYSGLNILSLAPEERVQKLKEMYSDILKGQSVSYKHEVAVPGGMSGVFNFKYVPLRNDHDEINGIMINIRNITNENILEEKLKQSEQQFREAFEHSAIGMALVDLDGNWMEVNEQLCEITGYTKNELCRSTSASITWAEDLAAEEKLLGELISGKRQSCFLEKRFIHKTGRTVWVFLAVSRVISKDHNIRHFIFQVEDISEKYRAEEQKEFERRDKEALINTTNDLIWSVSHDLKLIAANKSYLKNAASATGVQVKAGDYIFPENSLSSALMKLWKKLYRRALGGELFSHELFTPAKENNDASWMEINFNPILNGGKVIGVACHSRDITEIKQNQQHILDINHRLEMAQEIARLGYFEVNMATLEVFGSRQFYSILEQPDECAKLTLAEIFNLIHPEDKEDFKRACEEALKKDLDIDAVKRLIVGKGKIKYVHCKGAAVKNKSGVTIGRSGTVQDITERREAEAERNENERKYRLLFHNNPTPMFMLSVPSFNIIDVNDSAVNHYGYSRDKFLRMNSMELCSDKEVKKHEQFADNMEIQGTRNAGIWKHITSTGNLIDVEIITHDFNFQNQLSRIVLATDITKRLKAENELKASHEQLRQLSSHLQTIRENERTHIAREIHDELGQQLTGLRMDTTWIGKRIPRDDLKLTGKIKGMIQLIDGTIKTVRRISAELRPGILDDLGLTAALEWQTQEFEKRTHIVCSFKSLISEPAFSKNISTGIFRVYQETLTNVARHAHATKVETVLERINGEIVLDIKDNGDGFNVEDISKKKTLGLVGMRERASMFGGEIKIDSIPGRGTVVTLKIPIYNPKETKR